MKYTNTIKGKFISRPNRFVAHVDIDGKEEIVHVKNTGRCKELLLPGAEVLLQKAANPNRKTKYDLITVWKEGLGWVNIDSMAPNQVAGEWLQSSGFDLIRPEVKYGSSRIDFYMEKAGQKYLMEVKGCTLEVDGIGYFPDAPTERGTRHLRALEAALAEGYHCAVAFVIPMNGIMEVVANAANDPLFARTLEEVREAGVKVIFIRCQVEEDQVVPLSGKVV